MEIFIISDLGAINLGSQVTVPAVSRREIMGEVNVARVTDAWRGSPEGIWGRYRWVACLVWVECSRCNTVGGLSRLFASSHG